MQKYTITLHGLGGEFYIGKISEKVYRYFSDSGDLQSYISEEVQAPAEIEEEFPKNSLHELDDIAHQFGPFVDSNTFIEVKNEAGEVVHLSALDEDEVTSTWGEVLDIFDIDEDFVFSGLDIQKGVFGVYELYTDFFDVTCLSFTHSVYSDDSFSDDVMIMDIHSLRYNDSELKLIEEHSTFGKSAVWSLYNTKTNECIST
jgi:hypothetical protein